MMEKETVFRPGGEEEGGGGGEGRMEKEKGVE